MGHGGGGGKCGNSEPTGTRNQLTTISHRTYGQLQIWWQQILKIRLKTFNLIPGETRFSKDLSLVPFYYRRALRTSKPISYEVIKATSINPVLSWIVNPMGRILVRWKKFRNNFKQSCHPVCNRLYSSSRAWCNWQSFIRVFSSPSWWVFFFNSCNEGVQ